MELNDQSNSVQPTIPSSIPNEVPTARGWIIEITLACGYVKEVNAVFLQPVEARGVVLERNLAIGKHFEFRSVGCCNEDDDELTVVKDVARGSRLGACYLFIIPSKSRGV
ncbi:hypothetical protein Tco_1560840 [Tanacetum coccineum]